VILVYGATGTTGTLICEVLAEAKLPFAIAGRDGGRLASLAASVGASSYFEAAVHDAAALEKAFGEASLVISCAGPFLQIGEPVLSAAIRAGCDYLDTTGEQSFVRDMYERYDSMARKAGCAVVNACAFEVGVGDWAADVAAQGLDERPLDSVTISYAVDGIRPTRGTQLSAVEAVAAPGVRWEEDRWVPTSLGRGRIEVDFPEPFGHRSGFAFPSAEVITIPRHIEARRVETFMCPLEDSGLSRAAAMVVPVVAPVLGPFLRSPIGHLARQSLLSALPHQSREVSGSRFAVVAEARAGFGRSFATVTGENIYELSAQIAVFVARKLANSGDFRGVLAPSQVVCGSDALAALAQRNLLTFEVQ
jgi:short subunit dehydrogenase-like uncharacterized protein